MFAAAGLALPERRDGKLHNVEFATFPAVKDPAH
jgi:hypothetical protein